MSREPCTKCWCETVPYHWCGGDHDEHAKFTWGRCKSGKRWFWSVCAWPETRDGLDKKWPTWHGWTDTEETAKQVACDKVKEIAGDRRVSLHTQHHFASSTLREVSQDKRRERWKANPPKASGVSNHGTLWAYNSRSEYEERWRWEEHRIIKVTKKYVWVESWRHREDDSLIRIDRETLERDGSAYGGPRGWSREHYYTEAGKKALELEEAQGHANWLKARFHPLPEMPEMFTKADVLKAFREGSLAHHPDHGGDPAMFRKLVEAKEFAMEVLREREAHASRAAA